MSYSFPALFGLFDKRHSASCYRHKRRHLGCQPSPPSASAGMLWVVYLALLIDTLGPERLGQAVRVIRIPMSIGPIVGPLLGGIIYAHGGCYAVFGLMFALLGVDGVLRLVMIGRRTAKKWLGVQAVQDETVDVPPTSGSPAHCSKASGNSQAEAKNEGEAVDEAPLETQDVSRKVPGRLRLQLSFRMAGLIGGLLQSFLNVALDSTLPLTVETVLVWQ